MMRISKRQTIMLTIQLLIGATLITNYGLFNLGNMTKQWEYKSSEFLANPSRAYNFRKEHTTTSSLITIAVELADKELPINGEKLIPLLSTKTDIKSEYESTKSLYAQRRQQLTARRSSDRSNARIPSVKDNPTLQKRREEIRDLMAFMYRAYKDRAWGSDEVHPLTGTPADPFGHQGTTIVDSLSTLWVMGLDDLFVASRDWVRDSLNYDLYTGSASLFESNIRSMGGLLSAFDLSGDKAFLREARRMGDKMINAFNKTQSRMPKAYYNFGGQTGLDLVFGHDTTTLADMGTFTLEMRYLSKVTGDSKYAATADQIYITLGREQEYDGLLPSFYDVEKGKFTEGSLLTVGAYADSYYEYLLKNWLQGNMTENHLHERWKRSVVGMEKHLLKNYTLSTGEEIQAFDRVKLPNLNAGDYIEELSCFVPGMLVLGSRLSPGTSVYDNTTRSSDHDHYLELAEKLAYSCFKLFDMNPSGLAGDAYQTNYEGHLIPSEGIYKLRPETIESLFYMFELTGDEKYREWGWAIFQSIKSQCIGPFGLGEYSKVDVKRPAASLRGDHNAENFITNTQHSFVFAEVMKYSYLLMSPDHPISLDRHIFNTEAHPLSVFREL